MVADRLVMKVKQGEELNIGMRVRAGNVPLDLSEYSISFMVKRLPNVNSKPLVDKMITAVSDINKEGRITYPPQGEVVVHLTTEDTTYPIGEYALVVSLVGRNENNIISAPACSSGVFKICEQ